MKTKLMIMIGCATILLSGYAAASCNSCVTSERPRACYQPAPPCGCRPKISDCACADPSCARGEGCISCERCCRYFGNVGAMH